MARNSFAKRKFYNRNRSNFKRTFARERDKINDSIIQFMNQTNISETETTANERESENETAEQTSDFHSTLRDWALRYNIRTYCLRDLLKILRSIGVPFIPKDPATFLRTPNVIETERIANGEFWYAGISKNLRRILQAAEEPMELNLNIHVDGMQLFNSSSKQFWPILGQIHGWYTNSNDCS